MSTRKHWKDLSKSAKVAIMFGTAVQIFLQVAALRDLSRRTPAQVNGAKGKWVAASFLNFVGPIAYFLKGRKN
ncbi:PLDc N-terminal domain-containing protein [Arthrobacter sp. HLT1-20]